MYCYIRPVLIILTFLTPPTSDSESFVPRWTLITLRMQTVCKYLGSTWPWRWWEPNTGRHGVWNMIYFGIFRTVFPIVVPDQKSISKTELNVKRFLLGCICGTLGMLSLCRRWALHKIRRRMKAVRTRERIKMISLAPNSLFLVGQLVTEQNC